LFKTQLDLAPYPTKPKHHRITIVSTVGWIDPVCFGVACPLAFAAQLLYAGADNLEIVGSSGVSHVPSPVRPVERSSPRPLMMVLWANSGDKLLASCNGGLLRVLTPF
jgi:hypothetical protein